MKKIFYFVITLMMLLTTIVSYLFMSMKLESDFLFNHHHIFEIDFEILETEEDFYQLVEHLMSFSMEQEVHLSRQLFLGTDGRVDIYTTDLETHPHIHLRAGQFPRDATSYVANRPLSEANPDQVGQISFPGSHFDIRIYHFEAVHQHQVGLGDRLYLTGSMEIIPLFIEEFSRYGPVIFHESMFAGELPAMLSFLSSFGLRLLGHFNLLLLQARIALIFMIVASIITIYTISRKRKQFLLEKLWGYSNVQITLNFYKELARFYVCLITCLSLGLTFVLFSFHQLHFLRIYLLSMLVANLTLAVFIGLISLLGMRMMHKLNEAELSMRTTGIFKKMKGSSFVVKVMIYSFLWFNVTLILNGFQSSMAVIEAFNNDWAQTEYVYRVVTSPGSVDSGSFNFALSEDFEQRIHRFYQAMETHHEAFVIGLNHWNHPHFSNVTINENYLEINPILNLAGTDVRSQIIRDPYVLNILVPEQFRDLEDEIEEMMLQEFYFQKVEVPNMYHEELGRPILEEITIDDLSIQLIYVQNEQEYFTFSMLHGRVQDPIATILFSEQMHASMFTSLASNLFFYSLADEPFEEIRNLILENDAIEINRVVSVYHEAREQLIEIPQQDLFYRLIELILMIIFLFLMLFLFIWAHYQLNSYKLNLEYLFGYSYKERHQPLIESTLISIILSAVIVHFIFNPGLANIVSFFGLLLVVDLIVTWILSERLTKSGTVRVLKGGDL